MNVAGGHRFARRRRRAAPGLAMLMAMLLASCAAAPVAQDCVRRDLVSMGPENNFRIRISNEDGIVLRGDADRIDVGLSVVAPIAGPVALVQTVDGKEAGRWELKVIPATAISTRCRLAATAGQSTCGATLGSLPRSMAGTWTIEAGDNRVLEAGLAIRNCR